MKYLAFLFLIFFGLVSCGEASTDAEQSQGIEIDTTTYGTSNIALPPLHPQALKWVENWPVFEDFRREAISFKNIPLQELKNKSDRLLTFTDSLSKHIPDTLFSNAIQSRLTIVKTRVNLLKQEANKDRTQPERIEKNLEECQLAIKNLIVQINEKVLKDKIDLQQKEEEEMELKKQQKVRDSIFQLELQDQKNKK
ncbi:MAG: hypothetical protein R2793_07380 [Flavobacteriaceae bacterium]